MQKLILFLSFCIMIASCSEPVGPTPVFKKDRESKDTIAVNSTAEIDTIEKGADTIAKNPRELIVLRLYDDVVFYEALDNNTKGLDMQTMNYKNPWAIYFDEYNNVIDIKEVSLASKAAYEPFTMISDSEVRVNRGSNVEMLCRWYNIKESEFIKFNPNVKNINKIYAGETYRINCDCK